jgi:hypothetical protein
MDLITKVQLLGSVGEFVGAIAVVVTLIYLTLQMRQNTRALRLNTVNAVTEELQAMFSLLASDKGLTDIINEAGQGTELTSEGRVRYYTFTSNLLRIYENAYLQKIEGTIHEAHWTGITRMMIDYTKMASFPMYWGDRKHWLSDEFGDYMEAEIIPVSPREGVSIPGDYK